LGINEQELRALRTCCQEIRLSLVDIIPPLESTLTPISTNSEVSRDVEQHEREKRLMELKKIWMDEFIPLMEKEKRKPFPTKRLYNICIQGIPSSLRGRVWPIFIGNELRISNELYSILLGRADRAKRVSQSQSLGREGSVQLIQLDLSRTFPMLSIFQKSGPYHQSLANVLEAYTCYRPDVGYVQGMSYIAAMLLLNLNEYEAFVAFANLLNNPCYMAFFQMNLGEINNYMKITNSLILANIPTLYQHFVSLGINPDIYMIDWVLTMFSKALPLDIVIRIWDVLFLQGETFLFRTAIGLLKLFHSQLLSAEFDEAMILLTHLPSINENELFKAIEIINVYLK